MGMSVTLELDEALYQELEQLAQERGPRITIGEA